MDAGEQAEVWTVRGSLSFEGRQLDARENLGVEANRAPLDQPTPSISTSGVWLGGRSDQAKWQAAV